jgi:pimeloyl-ACP methyl ester carboxylesterase
VSEVDFPHADVLLRGVDTGAGLPVLFQHGLGGNAAQAAEVFPDGEGFRRLTLECRGQGRSAQGDSHALSIPTFAADVLAFADARGVGRFVAGGISMGAAIALHLAVRHPERVLGLILARPAWLWQKAPENMRPYVEVAGHLRNPDLRAGQAAFEHSVTARELAQAAPDNLASLLRFFTAENPETLAALLAAIAGDGPDVSEAEVRRISVPTLVLGTGIDVIHPLDFARQLAARISGARFAEITAKTTDRTRYVGEFRAALARFLSGLARMEGTAA